MKAKLSTIVICCLISFLLSNAGFCKDSTKKTMAATINQLVAQNMDLNFKNLAASTRVLAEEYARLHKTTPTMKKEEQQKWLKRRIRQKQTTAFYPQRGKDKLMYQAAFPAYFTYVEGNYTPEVWHELNTFVSISPMFRVAYNTFNDSWVYLTTVNEAFLIYPHLTLDKAINNYPPTKQIFYKAADFENRTFGWTPPYLDLAGAGMMVTVAYPIYDEDKLLGVVSRDITLGQLTRQQLKPVSEIRNVFCLIVDKNGLVIGDSRETAMKKINEVNKKAEAAIVYFRTPDGLASDKINASSSSNELFNRSVENIVQLSRKKPKQGTWESDLSLNQKLYSLTATRLKTTDWLVITIGQ